MKFEFDPKNPGQTASDVHYQLRTLAELFGAAGENDLYLTDAGLCGLMLQFQAMGEAMLKLERHFAELEQIKQEAA